VKAQPLNADTIDLQDEIDECGSPLVIRALRDHITDVVTAKKVIILTARIMEYDNSNTSEVFEDYARNLFRQQYFSQASVLKQVLQQILHEKLLTPAQKSLLIDSVCKRFVETTSKGRTVSVVYASALQPSSRQQLAERDYNCRNCR
jgi:hypothetical protein